jgi:hypothetical protein
MGLIASVPIVIMSNPSVPAKSLAEVSALAKKEGEKRGRPCRARLQHTGDRQYSDRIIAVGSPSRTAAIPISLDIDIPL